jgi:cytochrome c
VADAEHEPDGAALTVRLNGVIAAAMIVAAAVVNIGVGAAAQRSASDGVYTVDQAKRGRALYEKRCVLCHLDRGQGHEAMPEIVGQSLEREGDPEAPAIAGDAFQKKWASRHAWDLFSTTSNTMPVGSPRSLSPQEYADVLAYIFELNKFSAGAQELTPERAALESITIGR